MPTLEQEYAAARPASRALHQRAAAGMPSGIAHDGRAFAPFPFYVARADGAFKWDVDGHRYLDCWYNRGSANGWLNGAMTDDDVDAMVDAFDRALVRLRDDRRLP